MFVGLFCESQQTVKDALIIRKFYFDRALGITSSKLGVLKGRHKVKLRKVSYIRVNVGS